MTGNHTLSTTNRLTASWQLDSNKLLLIVLLESGTEIGDNFRARERLDVLDAVNTGTDRGRVASDAIELPATTSASWVGVR